LATAPNQVWSWDITKLLGPEKWVYYYLYVMLDIFSRYVVGWLLAERESAELAQVLIAEAAAKQGVRPDQLTIHSDRGSPMTAKTTALLMADLAVTKTHSRPHVSNDNPFSEAHFRTLKYRPQFPDRFGSPQHARAICRDLFTWYNTEHRHAGIALMTPETVHYGRAALLTEQRRVVLAQAYHEHPERFVRGRPDAPATPSAVWINPPRPAPPCSEPLVLPAAAFPSGPPPNRASRSQRDAAQAFDSLSDAARCERLDRGLGTPAERGAATLN
jgi:putative transposase